jgi:hypothetical protein
MGNHSGLSRVNPHPAASGHLYHHSAAANHPGTTIVVSPVAAPATITLVKRGKNIK